jgi:hypothetical protein
LGVIRNSFAQSFGGVGGGAGGGKGGTAMAAKDGITVAATVVADGWVAAEACGGIGADMSQNNFSLVQAKQAHIQVVRVY